MNPACRHARFRAELPHGGLPEAFAVVTACNPNGEVRSAAENRRRTEDFLLAAYDWARRQCDQGGTVISGFHTPVEKDVLAILARRGARILWVPARDLPKTTPKELRPAADDGRLIILSPFPYGHPSRPTRESCSTRNRFVLSWTADHNLAHVEPGSSLASDREAAS